MEWVTNYFVVAALFLQIFAGCEVNGEVSGGCVGPSTPPRIHDFSYTDDPLMVEASVTSGRPVNFNWLVRKSYDDGHDWPRLSALYYYIPDKGDDQFNIFEEKNGDTTKVRITGGKVANVLRMIYLQISVQYPCTSLQYIANAVTLQRLAEGTAQFATLTEVPRPEYIVHPGEDLSVPLKAETIVNQTQVFSLYGFARHLRREGDKLRVEQDRVEDRERYSGSNMSKVSYSSELLRENNVEKLSARMKFTPWSETDSGVFMATLRTRYYRNLPKSDTDRYFVEHFIRAFFDVRSQQVVPPAIIVYNELDWMFRGDEPQKFESTGTYIVPLSKASKWATSVRCIAHAGGGSPSLTTTVVNPNEPRERFENKSRVTHTKTVTADAFSFQSGEYGNYLCKASSGGKEVSLTFWVGWFTPVKLIRPRSPFGFFNLTTPVNFRCVGKTEPTTRSYVKFYRFNEYFTNIPKNRKAYLDGHETEELTSELQGVTLIATNSRDRTEITGILTIHNPAVLQGVKVVQCLVGDHYSYAYYRFWVQTK